METHAWEPDVSLDRAAPGLPYGSPPVRRRGRRPVSARTALAAAAFEAAAAESAVLATDGTILGVNRAWRRFGDENGAGALCGPGADYLRVTRRAADRGEETAAVVLAALEAVVSGGAPRAQVDYPCHSPSEQRWFRLVAERLPGRREVLVTHEGLELPAAAGPRASAIALARGRDEPGQGAAA